MAKENSIELKKEDLIKSTADAVNQSCSVVETCVDTFDKTLVDTMKTTLDDNPDVSHIAYYGNNYSMTVDRKMDGDLEERQITVGLARDVYADMNAEYIAAKKAQEEGSSEAASA